MRSKQFPDCCSVLDFQIHGGAYTSGASNDYDGDGLVAGSAGGVVVVTTNYR